MTWVRPELVCQVKYTEWTQDHRLRAPVYLGLRNDVKPKQVELEEPEPAESKGRQAVGSHGIREAPEGKELLGASEKEAVLKIGGRTLKFTNLKKVFYPDEGYTKRDVLNFYNEIAHLILPHLKDRPLSLKRYPNGIKEQFFFQKDASESFAPWLRTEAIESDHNGGAPIHYVFAEDRASLLYLVNLGCIDHNPWMSRTPHLDEPDFVLIDLDPQGCTYDLIVDAALMVKEILDKIGLKGYPKTTGGDGMHIYIPVEGGHSYEETRTFAELISRLVVKSKPEMYTTPRSVAKRQKNRVYFDYLQNGKSKTIAAPYVLRAYQGAPVATPLEWDEVRHGLDPKQFNIANAVERFREKGDLFAGVLKKPQRLEKALEKMEPLFRK